MIVLDTNQLERHSLDSSFMAILKVLARLTGNRLALSEVTYNEHCAHYENQLRHAYGQAEKSRNELAGLVKATGSREIFTRMSSADIAERTMKYGSDYQSKVLDTFDLIPLDGESAVEALRREAWRIPPASTSFDVQGTGARDAAIWLSLIKESIRQPERIFFISSDKRAFKAVNLTSDLDMSNAAITVLEDIGELLGMLADGVDVAVDVPMISESDTAKEKVLRYLGSTWIPSDAVRIAIQIPPRSGCRYSDHSFTGIEFVDARDIHGHVIGNEKWVTGVIRWNVTYSVKVEWHGRGDELRGIPDELWDVTFQTSTVLIFSASSSSIDEVEVLNAGKPGNVVSSVTRLA